MPAVGLGSQMSLDKLVPVFSVNTLIDTDMGLMNLILRDYNDPNIFDLHHDYYDLMARVYFRHYKNPLYSLCKPDKDKDVLDDYYEEFKQVKNVEILELALQTEIPNICRIYKDDGAILPIIMCDEGEMLAALNNINQIADIETKSFFDIQSGGNKYRQLFLRDFDELRMFDDRVFATIYLPDNGLMFDDNGRVRDEDIEQSLVKRRCVLNSFTMYRQDVVTKTNYDKYETLDLYLYEEEQKGKDQDE